MPVSHALNVSIFFSEMLKSDFFTAYYKQQTVPWLIFFCFFTNRGIIRQLPKALGNSYVIVVHTVQRFLSSESSSRGCTTCQRRALVCKSIHETHEPEQVPTDATEELEKESTGEPPESDHPKCADLMVANGRWSLTRIEPQTTGGFFEKKTGHIHFKEDNYCMQFPSYDMCSSMLLLFLPQEIRKLVRWSLTKG